MALRGTVPYAGLHHDPADFQVDNAVCGGSQDENPDYSVGCLQFKWPTGQGSSSLIQAWDRANQPPCHRTSPPPHPLIAWKYWQ